MKYAFRILNLLLFFFIFGCKSKDFVKITLVEEQKFTNTSFSAGRAEGLNTKDAFLDYGKDNNNVISKEKEQILILNKWQEL